MFTSCFPEIHLHTEGGGKGGGKNNLIKNNLLTSDNDSLGIIWKLFYKQIALDDKNIFLLLYYCHFVITLSFKSKSCI